MLHPFAALAFFKPRLIQALQGYSRDRLLRDIGAGITVGIVALPLAMAFAIASGLKPEAGIWTAIIAGAIVAALGGSAVQIAGPAGAFIVIVYGIVERYGLANLLIATGLAGVMLVLMGALKLGTLVRFVPVSIVMGFTNGIAVLIALSQLKDFLGLNVARMPADFFGQGQALLAHLHTFNPQALALGAACLLGLLIWPRVVGTAGQPGLAHAAVRALPSLEALQLHRATRVASRLLGPHRGAARPECAGLCAPTAGGHHRLALWRHPPGFAALEPACVFLGQRQPTAGAHADHCGARGH